MIQIAVVSGKGGTGKTVVTGAIAALLSGKVVMADCDVDAANLALLMQPEIIQSELFTGMDRAFIDPKHCIQCEICVNNCRFDAISITDSGVLVNPVKCEGCGVCGYVCPSDAVAMVPHVCGEIRSAHTRYGPFIDGSLYPGSGNSGLMVHTIRKKAREIKPDTPVVLIDGPPGIGCPLISAITGCDLVILVTEPGLSGRHDLERLVTVCRSLRCRMMMIINRSDLVPDGTVQLRTFAKESDIPVICEIPNDPLVIKATRNGEPFTLSAGPANERIRIAVEYLVHELQVS
ncbi:MAG: ATP-binding protein [Methanobacteriota archaeon]